MHFAIETSDEKVVNLLLEAGADIDIHAKHSEMTPPAFSAIFENAPGNNPKILKALLDHGADPNSRFKQGSILGRAVGYHRPGNVQVLLDAGARVDYMDPGMYTALRIAVDLRATDSVHILLEHGANPNTVHQQNRTPLSYSIRGKLEITADLLEHGADPNALFGTPSGYACLIAAISAESIEKATLLLNHKADPNQKGFDGDSPLHWSIKKGNHEITPQPWCESQRTQRRWRIPSGQGKTSRGIQNREQFRQQDSCYFVSKVLL